MGGRPRFAAIGTIFCLASWLTGCDVSITSPTSRSASLTPASSQAASKSAGATTAAAYDPLAPDTLALIPAECMLAAHVRPLPKEINPDHDFKGVGDEEEGPPSFLAALMNVLPQLVGNSMKPGDMIGMRITEAFFYATRYPYSLVLLDAAAKPIPNRPDSLRIDGLKGAAIVRTAGASGKFASILQQTLERVTSEKTATLVEREVHGFKYKELADSRLDPDEVVAWGEIGPHFVLTFGEGVFQQIAACAAGEQRSMKSDEWIEKARTSRAANTYVDLIFDPMRIRKQLDPHVSNAATEFFAAWDAQNVQRSHWSFGIEGKAMFCVANYLIDGETYERVYARAQPADAAIMATIPKDTNYAVYELPVGRFIGRFIGGLTATRDAKVKAEITTNWERLQSEGKFDGQRDILDHLGERIVIHKYPLHPLRIPVLTTTLIEIRDNPKEVARAVDALFTGWTNIVSEKIDKGIVMPATLTRDSDGIWFLNLGLAGPAWVVTDKYVVTSWSPSALRDYLSVAGDAAGKVISE
ncbi:MAG: hypothetical protein SF069_17130 [Phycisphaerae bacterium]|nr:hypothetical protein [Phycisphaerae bacterium]